MAERISAGILLYRRTGRRLEVLLAHPGGPRFAARDEGYWSIPKGEVEPEEALEAVARREFEEETGHDIGPVELIPLGEIVQKGGKLVHCWAAEGDLDPGSATSNTYTTEWPAGSGQLVEVPEIDRVAWFEPDAARVRVKGPQAVFIDRLEALLDGRRAAPAPTRRFDAVVFDLDGTLCDSEPFIAAAATEALRRRYGIVVAREDFAPFVGAGDDRFISGAAAAHGVTADLAVDKPLTYEVYLELIPGALQPIAGALAFLDRLRAAGLAIALATGSDQPKLRGNLAAIGLLEAAFDVVVSAEDVTRKKPDPETFLVAIGRLGVDPERCLVVEDARNGVLAGRAAGCEVLGIASSQTPEALLAAGARDVVEDYTGLPRKLVEDLGLSAG